MRHVNLEMGYSWYYTVIWARKRKSALALSKNKVKCVSPRAYFQHFRPLNPFNILLLLSCGVPCMYLHTIYARAFVMCQSTDYGVTSKACLSLKVSFFRKCNAFFKSPKQIFQITILSLKFE